MFKFLRPCTCKVPPISRFNSSWRIVRPRHPAFADLGAALTSLPRFRTRGEDLRVIYEPSEFYRTLLKRIKTAKKRIFISSLYVGKEETELIEALRGALAANPNLKLTILLDYLRSTRELPKASSASLVATLAAAFPKQVEFRLFHTSNLTGLAKKYVGRRFDEGWGLLHLKVYGFDDNVIISGANLSNDYFTNRQDRYIEIYNHTPLADYFISLLSTISSLSFLVTSASSSSKESPLSITWPDTNLTTSPLDSKTSITEFNQIAHEAFTQLTSLWANKGPTQLNSTSRPTLTPNNQIYDTSIRPILQIGPFKITQETDLTVPTIIRTANSLATAPGGAETRIDWTSGYFSLREGYREAVLGCKAGVSIVCAAPEANGFFGSKGVSKYIPPAYTFFEKTFYDETVEYSRKRRKDNHIEMREWKSDGWTYHAKGIWLTPTLSTPTSTSEQSLSSPEAHASYYLSYPKTPFLTLIGSSNFGRRSAERDLEGGLLITTFDKGLRGALKEEISRIAEETEPVNDKLFARKERKVSWGVKKAAKWIEGML